MPPLDRLAAGHRVSLHWAGRLLAGVPLPTEAAAALQCHFDADAPRQQAVEAGCLFPALLEAMAGSDAVCLRQMTQALATDQQRLQALWRHMRTAPGPCSGGGSPTQAGANADADAGASSAAKAVVASADGDAVAAAAADAVAAADAATAAATATDLLAFATLQTAHSQRMLAELLPMAGRLLDDSALARLDQALRDCHL